MNRKTLTILPVTAWGKWSVGLILAMPVLFFIGASFARWLYPSVTAGDTILSDITVRPALALTMLAGMASGIAAFITSILAIVKKETAVLVYAAGIIGAFLIFFLAGEVLASYGR
ncbi:MAG: hypothetical protein N2646_02515 [Bellilinea sp.]|nr:hypothetical protein [Bellilinea sp.]